MKKHAYKLRAEVESDIDKFLTKAVGHISKPKKEIIKKGFPDMTLNFYSKLPLSEIQKLLKKIPDGHVMLQTVQTENKYTGERNYEIS